MKAIFPGTFDPFTCGHRDIAERAAKIFGGVVVAVAVATGKNTASIENRTDIARQCVKDIPGAEVVAFDGLLSDFISSVGECVIVRGVRNVADCEYERDHARIYKSLCGADELCLFTAPEFSHISSSVVRELAKLGADISGYVPPCAIKRIKEIYGNGELL